MGEGKKGPVLVALRCKEQSRFAFAVEELRDSHSRDKTHPVHGWPCWEPGAGHLGWPRAKLGSYMEQSPDILGWGHLWRPPAQPPHSGSAVGSQLVTLGLVWVTKPCRDRDSTGARPAPAPSHPPRECREGGRGAVQEVWDLRSLQAQRKENEEQPGRFLTAL